MDSTTTNPRICFSENGIQEVGLVYSDYDIYRSPAGLKVVAISSDASPAWFESEGAMYANGGNLVLDLSNYTTYCAQKNHTHIGLVSAQASAPTNTDYILWIDTDEDSEDAMPANALKYKTFSIATSAWTGSGPYSYQMTISGVTTDFAVLNIVLSGDSEIHQKAQIDWETGASFVKLLTATKPTGTISGYLIAAKVSVS